MTREELLKSPEYWFEHAQNELFRQVIEFMENENLNRTQLANKLGVSKGYITQLLNGDFNHSLKKLIDLSLSIGMVPQIEYKSVEQVIREDKATTYFHSGTTIAAMSTKEPGMTVSTKAATRAKPRIK